MHVGFAQGSRRRPHLEQHGRLRGDTRFAVHCQRIRLGQHQVNSGRDHAIGGLQGALDLSGQRLQVAGALLGGRGHQAGLFVDLAEAGTPAARQAQRLQELERTDGVDLGHAHDEGLAVALVAGLAGLDSASLQGGQHLIGRGFVQAMLDRGRASDREYHHDCPQSAHSARHYQKG